MRKGGCVVPINSGKKDMEKEPSTCTGECYSEQLLSLPPQLIIDGFLTVSEVEGNMLFGIVDVVFHCKCSVHLCLSIAN